MFNIFSYLSWKLKGSPATVTHSSNTDLVGSVWHLRPTVDPFTDETQVKIHILDAKNGYVKYAFTPVPTLTYSMKVNMLNTLYEREEG